MSIMFSTPNDITITKGNSLELLITPYSDEQQTVEYQLTNNDKVYFTVKSNPNAERSYISKTVTVDNYDKDGKLVLKLLPEDTNLEPFNYIYDCGLELDNGDGDFYTFVKLSQFTVTPACSQKAVLVVEPEPEPEPVEEPTETETEGGAV